MSSPLASELELIAQLADIFGAAPPEVALGIADDCAALDLGGPDYLLWTVDTLVEGVHFDLAYTTLSLLGRKSLAVNLSDIAAMGGKPAYALLSLGWPPGRDLAGALEFGEGLAACARDFDVTVIGGDTANKKVMVFQVPVLGVQAAAIFNSERALYPVQLLIQLEQETQPIRSRARPGITGNEVHQGFREQRRWQQSQRPTQESEDAVDQLF